MPTQATELSLAERFENSGDAPMRDMTLSILGALAVERIPSISPSELQAEVMAEYTAIYPEDRGAPAKFNSCYGFLVFLGELPASST